MAINVLNRLQPWHCMLKNSKYNKVLSWGPGLIWRDSWKERQLKVGVPSKCEKLDGCPVSAVNSTYRKKTFWRQCLNVQCISSIKIWIENLGWWKAVKQTVVPSGTGKGSSDIVPVVYSILFFYIFICYCYILDRNKRIQWFIVALVNLPVEACCWQR